MRCRIFGFWPTMIGTGLVILLAIGIAVTSAFNKELSAKEQVEADQFSNMITQAEWRIMYGKWTEKEGVHYILTSESIDCPQGFNDLPPNIKIGDKVKLERKQGSVNPWRSSSYTIISTR